MTEHNKFSRLKCCAFAVLAIAIITSITRVESQAARNSQEEEETTTALKPTTSMPMWFYSVKEDFKYPIPCDFEFAFIDKTGKLIITGPFVRANPFKNGKARVDLGCYRMGKDGIWKLDPEKLLMRAEINKEGKVIGEVPFPKQISPGVVSISINGVTVAPQPKLPKDKKPSRHLKDKTNPKTLKPFRNKFYRWGFEDENGDEYIKAKFASAKPFYNGISRVVNQASQELRKPYLEKIKKLQSQSKASKSKKPSKDLLAAYKELRSLYKYPNTVGYINKNGKFIVPLDKFQEGKDFSDGLAAVSSYDKWGFIDTTGEEVIKPEYERVSSFCEGKAKVLIKGKFGYIDKQNKIAIPCKFALAGKFSGGLAPVTVNGKNWGYIDTTGKFKIAPNFKRTFDFSDGLALVMIPPRQKIENNPKELENFLRSATYHTKAKNLEQADLAFLEIKILNLKKHDAKQYGQIINTPSLINRSGKHTKKHK